MKTTAVHPIYQAKVDLWRQIFTFDLHMERELVKLFFRFVISAGIIILIFQGKMPGTWGGFYATIIMGIDLAAAAQALRESQTGSNQTVFDND